MIFRWPSGYGAALLIGVDDIHPESSMDGVDCGGDLDGGALGLLQDFLKRYGLKATLFATPCHIYRPQLRGFERAHKILSRLDRKSNVTDSFFKRFIKTWEPEKFRIDLEQHAAFVEYLNRLVREGTVEVGLHGFTHFNWIPPYPSEFNYLDKNECLKRIKLATLIMNRAGIPFELASVRLNGVLA